MHLVFERDILHKKYQRRRSSPIADGTDYQYGPSRARTRLPIILFGPDAKHWNRVGSQRYIALREVMAPSVTLMVG